MMTLSDYIKESNIRKSAKLQLFHFLSNFINKTKFIIFKLKLKHRKQTNIAPVKVWDVVDSEVVIQDLLRFEMLEFESDECAETLIETNNDWVLCELVLHPHRVALALLPHQLSFVVALSAVVLGATHPLFL